MSRDMIGRRKLCCGWLCYGASEECPDFVNRMLLPECCDCRSKPGPTCRSPAKAPDREQADVSANGGPGKREREDERGCRAESKTWPCHIHLLELTKTHEVFRDMLVKLEQARQTQGEAVKTEREQLTLVCLP